MQFKDAGTVNVSYSNLVQKRDYRCAVLCKGMNHNRKGGSWLAGGI